MHCRHKNARLNLCQEFGVHEWRWAVRSHAAGVWPLVAIVGSLVVLERWQGNDRAPIGDGHHTHLDAVEPFFDEDARGRCGELWIAAECVKGCNCCAAIFANKNTLASSQAVSLYNNRNVFSCEQIFACSCNRAKLLKHCCRHVASMEDLFAKKFATLQLCGLCRGAKDAQARCRKHINDPGYERRFWADDRQINGSTLRQRHQRRNIITSQRHIFGNRSCAGIARRHQHLGAVANQLPSNRVLAPTGADNQNATGLGHGLFLLFSFYGVR